MAKTIEELNELKKEYEELCNKLNELSEEELIQISGGAYRKDIGADKNAKVIFEIKE